VAGSLTDTTSLVSGIQGASDPAAGSGAQVLVALSQSATGERTGCPSSVT
jgi:hypothetical protein